MTVAELVGGLAANGVYLFSEAGKLGYRLSGGEFTEAAKTQIRARRAEIIEYLESLQLAQKTVLPPIEPQLRREESPLSYSQLRLWFIDQLEGQSGHYNMSQLIELREAFDVEAFRAALGEILMRHEVLRTVYRAVGGEPRQVLLSPDEPDFEYVDFSNLREVVAVDRMRTLVEEEAHRPFDLAQDQMLRAKVVKLAQAHYVVACTMHHIASDGWSLGVLKSEFAALYQAYREGAPSPLAPLDIQYSDYAVWQHETLRGEYFESQLAYWDGKLAGIPQLHSLPLDNLRPATQRFEGAGFKSQLPEALSKQLHQVCQDLGATLFMGVHAAFVALLSRYGQAGDVVVGTPVANRSQSELNPLIGFFVNTLVLRASLNDDPTFTQLLVQCRNTALEAYAHQVVPFERLVERLAPARELSHAPLFQIMLSLNNADSSEFASVPGQAVRLGHDRRRLVSKFDLTLNVTEDPHGLVLNWTYNKELFTAQTVERLASMFERLLDCLLSNPNTRISAAQMLTTQEQAQIQRWNSTDTTFPTERCIHELVVQMAQQAPGAIAAVCDDGELSYEQLSRRSADLVDGLHHAGVGPGRVVGLCLNRSSDLLIALLAILRSGAAYCPIDPDWPASRTRFVLDDADVVLTLTDRTQLKKLRALGVEAKVVDDPTWWRDLPAQNSSKAPPKATLCDIAYVIYTSGSTGRPKGVKVTHMAALNLSFSLAQILAQQGLSGHYRWAWNAPITFDSSVKAFTQLCFGVQLHMLSEGLRRDPARLVQYLYERHIDLLDCTPSVLELLLEEAGACSTALPNLIIGGEAIDPTLWSGIVAHCGQSDRFALNMYGPTECTVNATWAQVIGEVPSIGGPLPNVSIRIVDPVGNQVPLGTPGEILIGGMGVSRGYVNRPELNARCFIEEEGTGARWYRTGDIGRWLGTGEIAFLGRHDSQVKVNGVRIECAEIEHHLHRLATVKHALVVANGAPRRLIAYVVSTGGLADEAQTEQWRAALGAHLPDYMVPGAIVPLEAFPLTANGKVDTSALPAPQASPSSQYCAPVTELERKLCRVWEAALGIEPVSTTANFFTLGGHSLMATRVASGIGRFLGKEVPVRALFEYKTVRALARHLESEQLTQQASIPVAPAQAQPVLSFAQERLWFLDRLGGGSSQYNIPLHVVLTEAVNPDALQWALEQVVQRHSILRTTYHSSEGRGYQRVNEVLRLRIARHDLSAQADGAASEQARRIVERDARLPFDLSRDLMLRAHYIALPRARSLIVFNIHHIATDGWSMDVLRKEFEQLYHSYQRGERRSSLPALPIQYVDYAAWQRSHWEAEADSVGRAYWRKTLADMPQVHGLPLDHPRPPRKTFNGAIYRADISHASLAQIRRICAEHDVTMYTLLLAVFSALLSRYSNDTDVVIGTPSVNRPHPDVQSLIGFFVNTLVLRVDLDGDPDFVALLRRCRETMVGAFAHQDTPFEYLVEMLQPERALNYTPLVQIMLVLNQSRRTDKRAVSAPAKEALGITDDVIAKFDLTLNVTEAADALQCTWQYNTDIFEAHSVVGMAESFLRLLDAMLEAPDERVTQLPVLSPDDQIRIDSWNATEQQLPDTWPHQRFEQQAQLIANSVAIRFEHERYTYAQLEQRANQLARYLMTNNVGVGSLVGIYMDRSAEMVMALLGVIKCGAAYVPIDPSFPDDRARYMVEDSRLKLILCQPALQEAAGAFGRPVLALGEALGREALHAHADTPVSDAQISTDSPMAVIYTSGTTGRPKGVMVTHGGVSNFNLAFDAQLKTLNVEVLSDWLASASLSFDLSIKYLLALSRGATLHILNRFDAGDPAVIVRILKSRGIRIFNASPMLVDAVLDVAEAEGFGGFGVIVGGDDVSPRLWKRLAGLGDRHGPRAINAYGPTETTINSTFALITAETTVNIGRPVCNTVLQVLNPGGVAQPIGAYGELYIGGAGVAAGYVHNAELTDERFAYSRARQALRTYRTGDRVRWRTDGVVEFAGRVDGQVKLRGIRIEPAEVEAVLLDIDGIKHAVVVLRNDDSSHYLVAYLVVDPSVFAESEDAIEQGRRVLERRVPAYMVPTAFVCLTDLPLSARGKINRQALPAPQLQAQNVVPPATPTEALLVEAWCALLRQEQISTSANFFQVGGHSLLATRLTARIRERARIELPLRAVFEHPRLSDLAAVIDELVAQRAVLGASDEDAAGASPGDPDQDRERLVL